MFPLEIQQTEKCPVNADFSRMEWWLVTILDDRTKKGKEAGHDNRL
jgi:hypothetical protein